MVEVNSKPPKGDAMDRAVSVFRAGNTPEEWRVEVVNVDGDGGVSVTIFSGDNPEARARAYAKVQYPDAVIFS